MDVADCLRRVPLLKGLDPESIALLATHTRSVSFPANAMIVERGEVGVPLFCVLEGRAVVNLEYDAARSLRQTQLTVRDGARGFRWFAECSVEFWPARAAERLKLENPKPGCRTLRFRIGAPYLAPLGFAPRPEHGAFTDRRAGAIG